MLAWRRSMPGPTIDRALVLHVAKLASLSLTAAEADQFAAELARIVAHVEQLDELDTSDGVATAHIGVERTPWREDEPRPGLTRDEALAQAPRVEGDGFAVPAFIE
jgi:aspartyl-tRNA(Asn)/glutamyl-tRNA(Gln) amidotransferase subunit C